jgi:hypothetical protein
LAVSFFNNLEEVKIYQRKLMTRKRYRAALVGCDCIKSNSIHDHVTGNSDLV